MVDWSSYYISFNKNINFNTTLISEVDEVKKLNAIPNNTMTSHVYLESNCIYYIAFAFFTFIWQMLLTKTT